jgi:hypothetical protein
MKLIHADNPRLWFNLDGFGTVRPWGFVTKLSDGSFVITDEDFEKLEKEVAAVAWEGINGRRFLPYGGWLPRVWNAATNQWDYPMQDPKVCFTPYILDGEKWHLDWENSYYWPIVVRVAKLLKKYNTEMVMVLFDNCQFWRNPAWACWANNVQGLSSYMDDPVRAVRHTQRAILELGGMDNVLWEIVNEGEPLGDMQRAKDWYRAQFETLRDGGIPPENISVGACLQRGQYLGDGKWAGVIALQDWLKGVAEEVFGYRESLRIMLPVHNATDHPGEWWDGSKWVAAPGIPFGQMVGQANHFWGGNSTDRRCILSNDGLDDKDSAAALVVWRAMIRDRVRNYKQISDVVGHKVVYEFLSDSIDPTVKLAGIRDTVIGFCEGMQKQASECLVNFHRTEYVAPVEETPVEETPVVVTTTVEPPFDLKGELWNRRYWIAGFVALLILIVLLIIIL